jgi:hypothetical protein
MTCCLFAKPSQLSHCSKHLIISDFLSYQAYLAYNPKEFLGVITEAKLRSAEAGHEGHMAEPQGGPG